MMTQDWKIKSRGHTCTATGRTFEDEEVFYTALFEEPGEEGFVRRDYSAEAWNDVRSTLKPFSYWRTTYQAPKDEPAKREVVEKESAEGLLRRLVEEDDPLTENARFILAVMLERKKTLRETDSQSLGDAKLRIYEHAKTGEVYIIRDPLLRLDQLESIQREVAELLAGRGPGSVSPQAPQNPTPDAAPTAGDPTAEPSPDAPTPAPADHP